MYISVLSQNSFYNLLKGDNKSEKFFKVLNERIKCAQQEIKSTMSVNMNDLGAGDVQEPATNLTSKGKL